MNKYELKRAIDGLDDENLGNMLTSMLELIEENRTRMYNYEFSRKRLSLSGRVYASSEHEAEERVLAILVNDHDIYYDGESGDVLFVWCVW